jgi:excinuclease ABC subunit C
MASLVTDSLPAEAGVYVFENKNKKPIYIGKAVNIKQRVKQHFADKNSPKEKLIIQETALIKNYPTTSEFSALLLEAKLIKAYQPKYNLVLRDDKSRLYIGVTKETYPKVRLIRKQDLKAKAFLKTFGPLPNMRTAKLLLGKVRKIVPFCTEKKITKKPCFYSQLGLCSPCPNIIVGLTSKAKQELDKKYQKNIKRLLILLNGKGRSLLNELAFELNKLSQKQRFEEAAVLRDQISALEILFRKQLDPLDKLTEPNYVKEKRLNQSRALSSFLGLKKLNRIECYDVSNLNRKEATASMVVFENGEPSPEKYRRFKINTLASSDPDMLTEAISRRLKHSSWPLPDLIVLDGGRPQLLKVGQYLKKSQAPPLKVVGLAKRPDRLIFSNQKVANLKGSEEALAYLQRMRDEAHRFAKNYHLLLRRKELTKMLSAVK